MSNLNIGLEIEYPREGTDRWTERGRDSSSLCSTVRDSRWPLSGRPTYDGTVGLEVVSEVLNIEDASMWYNSVLDYLNEEYGERFAPVGILSNGSTAGLHMHLSPLSRSEARTLFDWSQEPWMQTFVCSSVTEDEAPSYRVFRSSHCNMTFDGDRYCCMNSRGGSHWEWRLPEPMSRSHLEIVTEFLRLFKEDIGVAREFAEEMLEESDEITSVRRAQSIGEEILKPVTVTRDGHSETEEFFTQVRRDNSMPYIHRVDLEDASYYAFHSSLREEFSMNGISFDRDTILDARTLRPIQDPETHGRIESAIQNWQETSRNPETTEYLKKIVQKKS